MVIRCNQTSGRVQTLNDAGDLISEYDLAFPKGVITQSYKGSALDVVVFSDWRVQNIETLKVFIADGPRPDLILYGGDDVSRFHTPERNYFAELAGLARYGLCAVAGNDDPPECRGLIAGSNVYAVHSQPLVLGPFAVVGLEGVPLFHDNPGLNRGRLFYPQRVRHELIKWWLKHLTGKKLIIISHTPPFGVLDFAVRFGPRHIGCPVLRKFLEISRHAILCVCGHVHRCGARAETLGNTLVVNAASHDDRQDPGRVGRLHIRQERVVADSLRWNELR